MNLLLAIIAFDFIVIVHELGHFIAAKLCNIKVEEFSLFIGPKLFSIQRGETVYSIRLIPALAYVKLEGEEEASDSERSYSKKPLWQRAFVIAAGPLVNIAVGIVFFAIVLGSTGFSSTKVIGVTKGSPAYNAGIRNGDKLVSYDAKKVYSPLDVGLFLYGSKGQSTNVEFTRDGEKLTTILSPNIIPEQQSYKLGFYPLANNGSDSNVIKDVIQNSPAEKAGLQKNDRIVKLNGVKVSSRQELGNYLDKNKDNPLTITVVRDGSELNFSIKPEMERIPEQYDIGMDFATEKGNLIITLKHSFIYTYSAVRNTGYSLLWLATGKVSVREMSGPVGIVTTINDVVQQSRSFSLAILSLLNITALISVALGIGNLLPIPPADGSKLVLMAVEGIRRKPLPIEKEAMINMIGFVFMMLLFIFITYNDILKLFTGR